METKNNPIHELFSAAAELPLSERETLIAQVCGSDADLRAHVTDLLAAHDRAGRFLADPTYLARDPSACERLAPSTQIGPYILRRVLGEGGYGTVYLADQEEPIRRRVALKVIKPGMDTSQIIARFELERQALAIMEHPNIARVLDAGSTESGRPYFVMELIDGQTITEYCKAANVDLAGRLAMFLDVCDALQHAHQKGVIHRDIKPSNVLVSLCDDKPIVKIIDFGIAKAMEGSAAAGRVAITQEPQLLGTPQCMSPEQVASVPNDVDTRSDIYALGVLLYELLVDAVPFDPARLRSAAYEEMRRIIREVDPPTPSVRLATLGVTSPTAGTGRRNELRRRVRQIRGELDWVVMKAMEKDRARRYSTVDALAADVSRYLRHEPVTAGRPGRWYRLSRFVRRNRSGVIMGTLIAASLAAGMGIATGGLVRARRARDAAIVARADEARQRAVAEANEARARDQADRLWAARAFLYRLLSPPHLGDVGTVAPVAVLDYVAGQVDSGAVHANPELEAPLRAALGNAYLKLKLYPQAERQFQASFDLHRSLDAKEIWNVASALNNLASAVEHTRGYEPAEPLFRKSLALYRQAIEGDSFVDAPVLLNLAILCANTDRLDEAESMIQIAVPAFESYYGREHPIPTKARKVADDIRAEKMRRSNSRPETQPSVNSDQ